MEGLIPFDIPWVKNFCVKCPIVKDQIDQNSDEIGITSLIIISFKKYFDYIFTNYSCPLREQLMVLRANDNVLKSFDSLLERVLALNVSPGSEKLSFEIKLVTLIDEGKRTYILFLATHDFHSNVISLCSDFSSVSASANVVKDKKIFDQDVVLQYLFDALAYNLDNKASSIEMNLEHINNFLRNEDSFDINDFFNHFRKALLNNLDLFVELFQDLYPKVSKKRPAGEPNITSLSLFFDKMQNEMETITYESYFYSRLLNSRASSNLLKAPMFNVFVEERSTSSMSLGFQEWLIYNRLFKFSAPDTVITQGIDSVIESFDKRLLKYSNVDKKIEFKAVSATSFVLNIDMTIRTSKVTLEQIQKIKTCVDILFNSL